ncbi:S8 family serine peptidase [Stenotrophomonas geniculata]|uniref:S8 family serine peptidase n=1 Tax=Stenotrophomonas geniculata TaxID=86188 RepID=UPI003AADC072
MTIGIIDDGLQIAHPDLATNVAAVAGWNFLDKSNDPTPRNPDVDNHGTMVGGIAAAVGANNLGVRGVAPAATLKGFNFLEKRSGISAANVANLEYAWWHGAEVRDVQVFNNSWGASAYQSNLPFTISRNEAESFEKGMSSTRTGLGGIYVKSAGNNSSQSAVKINQQWFDLCTQDTKRRGTGCLPAGFDPRNNLFNVITVAAVRADGIRSSYSSTGLDGARSAIDRTCNYTAKMSGTSAAAPTVSGVAALMLEPNPNLSYRDVKYILATTATRTDPGQADVKMSDGRLLVPGWRTNAAGHAFSNWYGFGVVNAARAVQMAENFRTLGALVDTDWNTADGPLTIGYTPASAARLAFSVNNGPSKIEAVQLGFKVNHNRTHQLQFVLISPSGTRSVVQPAFTGIGSGASNFGTRQKYNFTNWQLLSSNAFLD